MKYASYLALLFLVLVTLTACGGEVQPAATTSVASTLKMASPAFTNGQSIPARYTCAGQNTSPEMTWSGAPAGTVSFVLILEDHDAPRGIFCHWVLYNIPAATDRISEGVTVNSQSGNGGIMQGRNDFGNVGYGGPCPPQGAAHHYYFKLYALDTTLSFASPPDRSQVLNAMQGHVLAQGDYLGTCRG